MRIPTTICLLTLFAACSRGTGKDAATNPTDPDLPPATGTPPPANHTTTPPGTTGTPGPLENPMVAAGRDTFRYDTFGDEAYWGDTLRLHEAIAGAANGGVGDGLSPNTALALGLKVDVDAVPTDVADALAAGTVDLDDPASTLVLLKADAVVGVTGFFDGDALTSVGIQCALCHSTVDDAFAPGIGRRLDGWPNRDLDVGTIISLAPDLSVPAGLLGVDEDALRSVLVQWGPGKFDAQMAVDGKLVGPDGVPRPTLIPPAFGLAGVDLATSTGWGSVTYWNAFVATLEMHGQGSLYDPRLDDSARFPIAATNGYGHLRLPPEEDRVTAKLPALHLFQLSLEAPLPPEGSFDALAAERGQELFVGKARCAECHQGPQFTEAGWNLHAGTDIGIDAFQAMRSPNPGYRTTPLGGLFTRAKGGYYHDGRFATLEDVVAHYELTFGLWLTAPETADLVEYLKSL